MECLITAIHRTYYKTIHSGNCFDSSEIGSNPSTLKIGQNSYNGSDVETKFNYPCIFKL